MKPRVALLGILLGAAASLGAQSLGAGGVFGLWDDGGPTSWIRYRSLATPWLQATEAEFSLPSGTAPIAWSGIAGKATRLSATLAWQGIGANLAWFTAPEGSLPCSYGVYQWNLVTESPWGYIASLEASGFALGVMDFEGKGTFRYLGDLDIGTLEASVRGAWVGTPWWGWFGLRVSGDLSSRLDLFVFTPVRTEAHPAITVTGGWAQWGGASGCWRWSLMAAGGLFWSSSGTLAVYRQTVEPSTEVVSETRFTYSLAAQPGWWVAFRPSLEWEWLPGLSLRVARWLPWAGGWQILLAQSPSAQPDPSPAPGGGGNGESSSPFPWANALLGGGELSFSWSW